MVAGGHADHHFDHNEVVLFGNCDFIWDTLAYCLP